ncbi:hypothetical protein DSO57_1020886 [Entomophthora muscae]|uniref:Uncharacterized protein n=1 Tax=Entomophthora muscae TaxID=34485 RepID=A0ACC2RUL4_9FUNG|nr:hypothetical protein DSO57_1020886 [Entomophthora muscae]
MSNDIAQAAMEQNLLSDLVDHIGKWRYKILDLASKAQALNVFVYSKIWYVAHIVPFTEAFEKKVELITKPSCGTRPQLRLSD